MIISAVLDTLIDSIKILPFLFITYLLMEYLEHKSSERTNEMIQKSGAFGPLFGSILGVIPQCGFSTAASNLYAGRVLTLGTLFAVYLSTSDEMLPILVSEKVSILIIIKILITKVIIAMIAGFTIDAVLKIKNKNKSESNANHIHEICNHENCHCDEKNVFISALIHTVQIFIYIFLISVLINIVVESLGIERISLFLENKTIISVLFSALIGLIPNCAASVVITKLFIEGLLGFGAMIAGLLVGAGTGLLILFRVNDDLKDNLRIVGLLYAIGVVAGLILSLFSL